MIEWKKFSEEWPKCDWIWVSDHLTVWLKTTSYYEPKSYHEKMVWSEAKIEYPTVPDIRHRCSNKETEPLFDCWESEEGILYLDCLDVRGRKMSVPIRFCPHCGWSKEK